MANPSSSLPIRCWTASPYLPHSKRKKTRSSGHRDFDWSLTECRSFSLYNPILPKARKMVTCRWPLHCAAVGREKEEGFSASALTPSLRGLSLLLKGPPLGSSGTAEAMLSLSLGLPHDDPVLTSAQRVGVRSGSTEATSPLLLVSCPFFSQAAAEGEDPSTIRRRGGEECWEFPWYRRPAGDARKALKAAAPAVSTESDCGARGGAVDASRRP